jgi:hypothetical protein
MPVSRLVACALIAVVLATPAATGAGGRAVAPPIIRFSADDFWLNLHTFLYVLGRAEAQRDDPRKDDPNGAPEEQDKALARLPPDEQRVWRDAVTAYAQTLGKLDAVSDGPMVTATSALAKVGAAEKLGAALGAAGAGTTATLERAAPIYRKTWWSSHRSANEKWMRETQALVDLHGRAILAFISRAYQLPWPPDGYPVHVCAYANWAGAYSTGENLLIISSLDEKDRGDAALETVFHESMHQWDGPISARMTELARALGKRVPNGLTHAMIWMAGGEAVRTAIPTHVPIADAGRIWERGGNPRFKPALEAAWLPYLRGVGTRDDSLTKVLQLVNQSKELNMTRRTRTHAAIGRILPGSTRTRLWPNSDMLPMGIYL